MSTITDRQLSAIPSDKDIWIIESAAKGQGRFTVRLTKSGERLFYFRYTDENGNRVRLPIGSYDREGLNGLTLKDARRRAAELSRLYQDGATNLREYLALQENVKEIRLRDEIDQAERDRALVKAEEDGRNARMTVRQLFERWMILDVCSRKDEGVEVRRMLEKDMLPILGDLAVEDIKKSHVMLVTDELLARGVKRMGKVIFALMRQMFNFAVERDIIAVNPTATISKAKIFGADNECDRILMDDEIKEFAEKIKNANLMPTTQAALWIALATCCRIGEILSAEWRHVDLQKKEWVIPANKSKNGKPHMIYLSDIVVDQFKLIHSLNWASSWCFPNRSCTDSVCSKTITKQVTDRQKISSNKVMSGRSKYFDALQLSGGYWTPHDLRRTGASLMVKLGVVPEVADRCMNHIEQNKVKRTYLRYDYAKEMKEAWEELGAYLHCIKA